MGSPTKLSPLTERFIVELLLTMNAIGDCLARGDIKDGVAKYLANTGQFDFLLVVDRLMIGTMDL